LGRAPELYCPPDFAGNTTVGSEALSFDTTGNFNTAIGDSALKLNTTGSVNTAIGLDALISNTIGHSNTATGGNALFNNTEGIQNTATGIFAVFSNTTGDLNTGVGLQALALNVTGSSNTALGANALISSTGNGNTALGAGAGSGVGTASNVIAIGSAAANVSDSCFIGNIRGVTTANADAIAVVIDSGGQLGTVSSSRRFKQEIKAMDSASEAIHALKPVTFHYKSDGTNTPQFGLIAEEVAEVNQDLVVRDKNGEIYTVRYEAVNTMLLNEFLKEHKKVEAQQATIAEQQASIAELKSTVAQQQRDVQATVAQQQKQIEALTAGLQKVSAQLETSKPAPQVVENSR
jgi:uncharacterized coiled-coil protein SlyX